MTVVKLTEPGSSLTMLVQSARMADTGKYPGMVFSGMSGGRGQVSLEMPKVSFDRQISRLGLTVDDLPGSIVTISRDPNHSDPSKPYWGLSVVGEVVKTSNGNGAASQPFHQPTPPEDPDVQGAGARAPMPTTFDGLAVLLNASFDNALHLSDRAAKRGVTMTPESIASITATLFIRASR